MSTPVTRLRLYTASALLSSAACTYAGVRLMPKHPVIGGLLGFFVVSPVVSYGLKMAIAPNDSFAEFAASDALPPPDNTVRSGTPTPVPDQPIATHDLVKKVPGEPIVSNPPPVLTFIPLADISSHNETSAAADTSTEYTRKATARRIDTAPRRWLETDSDYQARVYAASEVRYDPDPNARR